MIASAPANKCGRGREPWRGGSRAHNALSIQSRATSVARTLPFTNVEHRAVIVSVITFTTIVFLIAATNS